MKLKIEKGVPIPKGWVPEKTKLMMEGIRPMAIGDSVTVMPESTESYGNTHTKWGRIFRRLGYRMKARKENGHIRLWRIG